LKKNVWGKSTLNTQQVGAEHPDFYSWWSWFHLGTRSFECKKSIKFLYNSSI